MDISSCRGNLLLKSFFRRDLQAFCELPSPFVPEDEDRPEQVVGFGCRIRPRLGRGDRRTALRFALAVGAIRITLYVFTHHVGGVAEWSSFSDHLASALLQCGRAYIFYLAIEPYARKLWPRMLTSWVRQFEGRFRVPLVGRDVLIGLAFAAGLQVFVSLAYLVGERFGLVLLENETMYGIHIALGSLRGLAGAFLTWPWSVTLGMEYVFIFVMLYLISKPVVRRDALTLIPSLAIMVVWAVNVGGGPTGLITYVAVGLTFWFAFFRFGLLVMVALAVPFASITEMPLTYDLTAWWAAPTWITLGSLLLLAIWSFRVALAGQPVFRDRLLEG